MSLEDETVDLPRRTDAWHFEKRLSLDTLVAIGGIALVIGGPVLYWGKAMDARVTKLEIVEEGHQKQETARELDARDQRIAVLGKMEKLDDQVTQLRIDVAKLLSSSVGRLNGR